MERTDAQNRSMHKFFRDVADTLRASGLDVRTTLKEDFELEWSEGLVKEILWRTAQKIVFDKISTKDLTTKEVTEVYDMVNRFLAKHKIHVPWPSIESQSEDGFD